MQGAMRLSAISDAHFDVAVIGGGINGAAGAQQLAARGYKVLLVDKNDFGSGSSSRSSRLLHCGLRYLAPGSSIFDFVFHPGRLAVGMKMAKLAIEARHDFVSTTPERVVKSRLHFPIYKKGTYAGWHLDVAFKMLQYFNKGKTPLNYRRMKGDEVANTPLVNTLRDREHIDSVAVYDEYQITWPERIVIESALDARRMGATVLNYVAAKLVQRVDSWQVRLTDTLTDQTVDVYADAVVNAAGIWVDDVFEGHRPDRPPKVLGTKGSHIVVELPESNRGIGVATLNRNNEPLYCLPWGRYHYIGPTELVYPGDKDNVTTTPSDLQFLLNEANYLFPTFNLTERDVVFTWSGVRPLTWDPKLPKGNRNRVLHDLSSDGLPNVFAMTGGPIMTYRSAGAEIAATVANVLGARPVVANVSYASEAPGPEADGVMLALKGKTAEPAWLTRMISDELVVHLSDIILRRSGSAWYHDITEVDIRQVARYCAGRMGWSATRMEDEITQCMAELAILQQAG